MLQTKSAKKLNEEDANHRYFASLILWLPWITTCASLFAQYAVDTYRKENFHSLSAHRRQYFLELLSVSPDLNSMQAAWMITNVPWVIKNSEVLDLIRVPETLCLARKSREARVYLTYWSQREDVDEVCASALIIAWLHWTLGRRRRRRRMRVDRHASVGYCLCPKVMCVKEVAREGLSVCSAVE